MSEQNKTEITEEAAEEKTLEFAVMPGADVIEDDGASTLDLSFENETEETAEAETEETAEAETEEAPEAETAEAETETEEAPEAETEETAEAETEAEVEEPEPAAAPKASGKKSPMVPKARLDEVLAKQKALQKQLDEVTEANKPAEDAPEEYDFDTKEHEYQNMVLDGKTAEAVALRKEIQGKHNENLEYRLR